MSLCKLRRNRIFYERRRSHDDNRNFIISCFTERRWYVLSTKPLRWKHRLKRKRRRFPAWSSESHTQNSSGCGAARFACERPYVRRRIRARARQTCVAFGAFGSACLIRFTSRINYDIIIVRRKRIEQVRAAFGVEEEISAFFFLDTFCALRVWSTDS